MLQIQMPVFNLNLDMIHLLELLTLVYQYCSMENRLQLKTLERNVSVFNLEKKEKSRNQKPNYLVIVNNRKIGELADVSWLSPSIKTQKKQFIIVLVG